MNMDEKVPARVAESGGRENYDEETRANALKALGATERALDRPNSFCRKCGGYSLGLKAGWCNCCLYQYAQQCSGDEDAAVTAAIAKVLERT